MIIELIVIVAYVVAQRERETENLKERKGQDA